MTTTKTPLLILTSFHSDGELQTIPGIYLSYREARDAFIESCRNIDYNTEVHHTTVEITAESLREQWAGEDLIRAVARYCALVAVEAGAPAIAEGTIQREWAREIDAFEGDYDFLREVCGADVDRGLFRSYYLDELFEASPCA